MNLSRHTRSSLSTARRSASCTMRLSAALWVDWNDTKISGRQASSLLRYLQHPKPWYKRGWLVVAGTGQHAPHSDMFAAAAEPRVCRCLLAHRCIYDSKRVTFASCDGPHPASTNLHQCSQGLCCSCLKGLPASWQHIAAHSTSLLILLDSIPRSSIAS